MIDTERQIGSTQAIRESKAATADTAANYMTELNWLVEEIAMLDANPSSLIHARLISDLTAAIVKQTLLLRQSVRETVSYHQNLCLTQNLYGETK